MLEYSSNMEEIIGAKLEEIKELRNNPDPILRAVALTVLPELLHRVHQEGKDSDGNQIGTYSPGYMKVRTGNFQNSGKYSKGAKKGQLKDAGKHTKGLNIKVFGTVVEDTPKAGTARPKYSRTDDTKVVLSLTRQMERDTSVVDTETGYGIGYLNPLNYKKALWSEGTYKKPILTKLTTEEVELANNTAREFLEEYLKINN